MKELIDFTELEAAGLLPEPPAAVQALLPLCRDGADLAALAAAIARQPRLSAGLARLAGHDGAASAAALAALGPAVVQQMTLALGMLGAHRRGPCSAFAYPQYWSRALALACAAQQLGGATARAALFSAGLLAGCGQLGLASSRPRSYAKLLREAEAARWQPDVLLAMEEARYCYNHLKLGAAMLRHWNVAPSLAEAVQHLDAPEQCATAPARALARQLHLAQQVAQVCAADPEQRAELLPELAATGALLELNVPALLALTERAGLAWRRWCVALDLPCVQRPRPAAAAPIYRQPERRPT
ncbi:HDOD domain-containing protein [Pseudoduganella aquatica]|uniref:HDOD domain-containing protein n=1 Tax=Pseudoduganella aquatica TaxID=2660641 RepID=UPI001E631788|nr:HDOD domain-containing protein [Pseudoduganella aquatica]